MSRPKRKVEQSNVRVIRDEPPVVVHNPREQQQTILARCYVAMAEVDYDLRMWRTEVPAP